MCTKYSTSMVNYQQTVQECDQTSLSKGQLSFIAYYIRDITITVMIEIYVILVSYDMRRLMYEKAFVLSGHLASWLSSLYIRLSNSFFPDPDSFIDNYFKIKSACFGTAE